MSPPEVMPLPDVPWGHHFASKVAGYTTGAEHLQPGKWSGCSAVVGRHLATFLSLWQVWHSWSLPSGCSSPQSVCGACCCCAPRSFHLCMELGAAFEPELQVHPFTCRDAPNDPLLGTSLSNHKSSHSMSSSSRTNTVYPPRSAPATTRAGSTSPMTPSPGTATLGKRGEPAMMGACLVAGLAFTFSLRAHTQFGSAAQAARPGLDQNLSCSWQPLKRSRMEKVAPRGGVVAA